MCTGTPVHYERTLSERATSTGKRVRRVCVMSEDYLDPTLLMLSAWSVARLACCSLSGSVPRSRARQDCSPHHRMTFKLKITRFHGACQ